MNENEIRQEILENVRHFYLARKKRMESISKPSVVKYAGRYYDEAEMVNLVDASLDFWLTEGRFGEEFEFSFSEYLGVSEVMLLNSGSSANLASISALCSSKLGKRKIRRGDEIITVAAAFPSTVNPIVQNGLVPVFVDIEIGNYNVIPKMLSRAISTQTRGIVLAHALGIPFDLDTVMELAEEHDLWVIEDSCDALGSRFRGKLAGAFGHLATFSFYPAHHITMGEGGAVVTNDEELARIVRSIRDWGRDCYCKGGENNTCGRRFSQQHGTLPYGYDHKYVYSHIGYNLKITDMQAAIGCAQLKKMPKIIQRRKKNFSTLYEGLKAYEDQFILPKATKHSDPCWFAFPITIHPESSLQREELTHFLASHGVETRNFFSGNLIRQPAYQDVKFKMIGKLENTDLVMRNTFFLGVHPVITREQIDYELSVIDTFLKERI